MPNRRTFITAAGTAAITGLAGCSGGDSSDSDGTETPSESTATPTPTPEPLADIEPHDGPAEFAVYDVAWVDASTSWNGSDAIAVGSTANVELIVGNRGGESGTFSGEFVAESATSTQAEPLTGAISSIEGEIPSGRAVTVTTETLTPRYAGNYEVTLRNSDEERLPIVEGATDGLTVAPNSGGTEEMLPLKNELRMSVRDVRFEQGLHYQTPGDFMTGERIGLLSTLDDQTFAIVHAVVENAGNEAATVDRSWLTFGDEAPLEAPDSVRSVDGNRLNGVTVDPGTQAEGWLLFRVPRESVAEANLNAYHDGSTTSPESVWELDLDSVTFPTFELESMDVPSQFDNDVEEQPFEFTVRNTGEAGGTFRGAVEWRDQGASDWEALLAGNADLTAEIKAGESATVSTATTYQGDSSFEYRFNPFGETFLIE